MLIFRRSSVEFLFLIRLTFFPSKEYYGQNNGKKNEISTVPLSFVLSLLVCVSVCLCVCVPILTISAWGKVVVCITNSIPQHWTNLALL